MPSAPPDLAARLAWLPDIDASHPIGASEALPAEGMSLAYYEDDPQGFCDYVAFLAGAMNAFKLENSETQGDAPFPLMIMMVESADGAAHQVPEEIAGRLVLWAGTTLDQCADQARAIGGIGLRLSQSLTGIAYAYAGEPEWEIAGAMPMDLLPDVPSAA